jgi:HEAT repeat protein
MFTVNKNAPLDVVNSINTATTLSAVPEAESEHRLQALLAELSPDKPWGEREIAAKQLGRTRNPEALPGLLAALQTDPFWMVRCAIIQALERIDDPRAIPTLREVAKNDSFNVVREYAATAMERLSTRAG